jgi:hypothetical protein
MNADDFVAACRREWERLRVPAETAEEMAVELRSDLAEAAEDGVSAEELLGAGVFDARGFAASWASERGVVPAPRRRRAGLVAGVAAAVAAIGLAVGLLAARSTSPKQASPSRAAPTVLRHPVVRRVVLQLSQPQQRTFTYVRP